ncbi:hypothetical protein [Pseudogemmobacter sp. W21_MBD1_M6]|uniref:hypothetical protein n=1 Tax=Pseudogemmobacter sp. W21_MBD1_M6 TaxID=3240271 RepID=UPI003F97F22A
MEIKKIAHLQQLTGLIVQADLAALKQTGAERIALEQDLANLAAISGEEAVLLNGFQPAQFCGARNRWDLWRDRARIAMNQKLARLRVRQEEERQAVQKSFGRDQAVQDMFDRCVIDAERRQNRF